MSDLRNLYRAYQVLRETAREDDRNTACPGEWMFSFAETIGIGRKHTCNMRPTCNLARHWLASHLDFGAAGIDESFSQGNSSMLM